MPILIALLVGLAVVVVAVLYLCIDQDDRIEEEREAARRREGR